MAKLIFGCGYLGKRVAERWCAANTPVVAVTRSSWCAPNRDFHTFNADVLDLPSLVDLRDLLGRAGWEFDTLLYSIGFDHTAGESMMAVYDGGLQNVLEVFSAKTKRVIYISTTGVFGDAAGDWIDELTSAAPERDGGRASLAAERTLAAHPLGKNSVILRLAGLYGPGRVPFLDKLRAGEAIPAAENGHLNLIHVDDAARTVVAAGELLPFDNGPRVYCVSDGQPVVRGDYYREVARQVGAQAPRFIAPDPASPRAARAEADRRVRNTRMLSELNVSLVYPDYRAGLAAILR
jgi:nucleoside-diphosphate-sugar epimerase